MNILLVTPLYSIHYDAGWFWLRALNQLGHSVQVWDYRLDKNPPPFIHYPDVTIVLKGESIDPRKLPSPKFNYWPDAPERTPGIEEVLQCYDKVFYSGRPTPEWMVWLPIGWDPAIHRGELEEDKAWDSAYIGTANSNYKREMIREIKPDLVCGNGWEIPPVYLHELVWYLNRVRILIDVHQSPAAGPNRKLFEMIACGFTIVDKVPGVEEILGPELAGKVTFSSPDVAKYWIELYLRRPEERERLWKLEKKAIEPYTYENCMRRVLKCLK